MWTIQEMKERGKAAFKANYWPCVLVALLMGLLEGAAASTGRTGGTTEEFEMSIQSGDTQTAAIMLAAFGVAAVVLLLLRIFLRNPIEVGGVTFFTRNIETGPAPFGTIKSGFQNYWHTFIVLLLRDVYLALWLLLLLVPGLIKIYSYRMVPYILAEHPELSANEVITRSRKMMDGNKWQSFKMDLSFLGWILLGIVTLGLVNVFWTAPYMESAQAALYVRLRDEF